MDGRETRKWSGRKWDKKGWGKEKNRNRTATAVMYTCIIFSMKSWMGRETKRWKAGGWKRKERKNSVKLGRREMSRKKREASERGGKQRDAKRKINW